MDPADSNDASLAAWERLLRAVETLDPGGEPPDRRRFRFVHRQARELVLHPAEAHQVVFVARGFVRFYTCADDGAEHNQFFGAAGDFVHAFLAEQQGIPYGAEALEASDLLVIDTADWDDRGPGAGSGLVRAVRNRMLEHKARHSQILQHRDSLRRIEGLRAWRPEWWVRAPQYHLANYLGVSEVTLSRTLGRNRS